MSGFGIVRMKTDESRKAGVSRSVPGNGLGGDQRRSPRSRLLDRNHSGLPITHAEIIATVHLKTLPDSQQTSGTSARAVQALRFHLEALVNNRLWGWGAKICHRRLDISRNFLKSVEWVAAHPSYIHRSAQALPIVPKEER